MRKGMALGNRAPLSNRKHDTHYRQRILIVCEGAKTEPNYFQGFRIPSTQLEIIGEGANTVQIVEKALEIRDKAKRDKLPFDSSWAVFDRDSFPIARVNRALELASQKGINVAFSNEAFEIWYLLHYEYRNTAMSRSGYSRRLSGHLGNPYKKNSLEMYAKLLPHIDRAILHAQNLRNAYNNQSPLHSRNPYTSVDTLVKLLKNIKCKA